MLGKAGYECDTAETVDSAESLLQTQHYDLLIADSNLPGGESVELIEHVQCNAPGLPVIVVTESPSLDSAIRLIGLPVVAYLAKSDFPNSLRETAETVLANMGDLRVLRRIQRHLRECAADLTDADPRKWGLARKEAKGGNRVPLSTLRSLAGCLAELIALEAGSDAEGQVGRVCELLQCPVWRVQRTAIHKCILLLHETKRRFKSKELSQVREILEGLLNVLA